MRDFPKDRQGRELDIALPEPSFGAMLADRRRELGLDITDVCAVTRISPQVLADMEAQRPIRNLHAVFVRGFVRSYSEALGLDPEAVLGLYDETRLLAARQKKELLLERKAKKRLRRLILFFCAALAAGLAGAMPVLLGNSNSAVEPTALAEPADKAIRLKVLTQTPAAVRANHVLEVTALATTRLKVIADGKAPQSHQLAAGDRLVLEACEQFNLLIDSAGAVQLFFDGKPVPLPARAGMAVNIRLP